MTDDPLVATDAAKEQAKQEAEEKIPNAEMQAALTITNLNGELEELKDEAKQLRKKADKHTDKKPKYMEQCSVKPFITTSESKQSFKQWRDDVYTFVRYQHSQLELVMKLADKLEAHAVPSQDWSEFVEALQLQHAEFPVDEFGRDCQTLMDLVGGWVEGMSRLIVDTEKRQIREALLHGCVYV